MYEEIIAKLAGLIQREVTDLAGDLGAVEKLVVQKVRVIGQGLLQRAVDQAGRGYAGSTRPCPSCSGSMRFVGYRSKEIQTLLGWITIQRAYYHCAACGTGLCPHDQKAGLGPGHLSPGLAEACCLLASDDGFQDSSRKIEHLVGQRVSDDSIERLVQHVGSVALARQQQEQEVFCSRHELPAVEHTPQRLYVSLDGTTVHQEDGWHEAKVGCLYWQDARWEPRKRYVSGFEDSQTFGWRVWSAAWRCGLRQAQEVIVLGDGAAWIRTEGRRHFPGAVFIVDWYHANEHLWDCAETWLGEGTAATAAWVKKHKRWLWQGQVDRLLGSLARQLRVARGARRQALERLRRYLQTNRDRMRYAWFRRRGYDIGSGAAEGACKYVVGRRLKGSGMIWSRRGASATLALRVAWLNQEWEALWDTKPLAC